MYIRFVIGLLGVLVVTSVVALVIARSVATSSSDGNTHTMYSGQVMKGASMRSGTHMMSGGQAMTDKTMDSGSHEMPNGQEMDSMATGN